MSGGFDPAIRSPPFERPDKFNLKINLRIAKALGIELSPTVLARVDEALMPSAQQVTGTPRVIQLAPADFPEQVEFIRKVLCELGYVEERNIRLEFRSAAGNVDALPALAQEIVRGGGIDAILAPSTAAALAAYKATQTIPIIAIAAVDPVGLAWRNRTSWSQRHRHHGFCRGNLCDVRRANARGCPARGPSRDGDNKSRQGCTEPCSCFECWSSVRLYG